MLTNRQRLIVKTAVLTLLGAGVTAGAAGLALLYGGWYNIGATAQHFPFVYSVLEEGMKHSVRNHAEDIKAPRLGGASAAEDNAPRQPGAPGTTAWAFARSC